MLRNPFSVERTHTILCYCGALPVTRVPQRFVQDKVPTRGRLPAAEVLNRTVVADRNGTSSKHWISVTTLEVADVLCVLLYGLSRICYSARRRLYPDFFFKRLKL